MVKTKMTIKEKMFGYGDFKDIVSDMDAAISDISPLSEKNWGKTTQKVKSGAKAVGHGIKSGLKSAGKAADNFGDWAANRQSTSDMFSGQGMFDVGGGWEPRFDFFAPKKPKTTPTQRIEAARLNKKAEKLSRSLGVSKQDALEYIRSNPHYKGENKKQKNKQQPHYKQHQESEQERRIRERKRYDNLLSRGHSPSSALQIIEGERNRRR